MLARRASSINRSRTRGFATPAARIGLGRTETFAERELPFRGLQLIQLPPSTLRVCATT